LENGDTAPRILTLGTHTLVGNDMDVLKKIIYTHNMWT